MAEQSPGGDRQVTAGWFATLFKVQKISRRATDLEISESGKNQPIALGIELYWDVGFTGQNWDQNRGVFPYKQEKMTGACIISMYTFEAVL